MMNIASAFAANSQAPSFTQGLGKTTNEGLFDCGPRARISRMGTITAEDGSEWVVPGENHFDSAPKAADLYNECNGNTHASLEEVDPASVPVFDAGGEEEFVMYLFADNYFELYVNGTLLAVDPVPFTPFNSNLVRFKARRPMTVAVKMIDWEENLGLGSEHNRGADYHPGDGGLVAHIQDAKGKTVALTDSSWKAQTFYIAPLQVRNCLTVKGQMRDSSRCAVTSVRDGSEFSAAHWAIPPQWMSADFDDSIWPYATTFSNKTVGVDNKRAYTNFTTIFDSQNADAQFIWSSNLVLDNVVLLRKTIE
ncbi:hypothetical protein [Paraglaciecola mesophila]|nr:hypothetical protein [Paraglaciecola mesophila]